MAAPLEIVRKDYCEIFDEVLCFWEKYADEYRGLLDNYYEALAKRKPIKIKDKPINPIKKSALKDFPEIALFYISNEDEAIEYLLNLTSEKLILVYLQIYEFINSKLYEDLKGKTFDWKHQVMMNKAKKSKYAMSPEACRGGKKASHHRLDSDFNY